MNKPNVITAAEAARRLQCSRTTAATMCRNGRLKAQRVSGIWAVDPASVDELVASGYSAEEARRENGRKAAKRASKFNEPINSTRKRKPKKQLVSAEQQTAQDALLAKIAAMGVRNG